MSGRLSHPRDGHRRGSRCPGPGDIIFRMEHARRHAPRAEDQIYVHASTFRKRELGRVKLGQKAEVRVDSFPKTVFAGVVEQINQQAEFLPRNVQTREERVHQVFGVKIPSTIPPATFSQNGRRREMESKGNWPVATAPQTAPPQASISGRTSCPAVHANSPP